MTSPQELHLLRTSSDRVVPETISPNTGPFNVIRVGLTTNTINGDGIQSNGSINRATLAPSAKFAERQNVFSADKPVDKGDDKVDEGGGQTTAEDLADALHRYALDGIELHVREGHDVQYVVCWKGCTSTDVTVEQPGHITEHFINSLLPLNAEE